MDALRAENISNLIDFGETYTCPLEKESANMKIGMMMSVCTCDLEKQRALRALILPSSISPHPLPPALAIPPTKEAEDSTHP